MSNMSRISVLQCVTVCCSVLQCVTEYESYQVYEYKNDLCQVNIVYFDVPREFLGNSTSAHVHIYI